MKKLTLILTCMLLGLTLVQAQSRKEKKKAARQEAFVETKVLIETGEFVYQAEWATTQKGRRINLISNPNSFKISDEQALADMPYFGEVQVYDMSGDAGINIDSPIENYKVEYNEKKMKATITFNATSSKSNETYECIFIVSSPGSANLSITSTARNRISYDGQISALSSNTQDDN